LINKFRGDPRLFSSGIEYIERQTHRPVLGLIPYYQNILIDTEDSVAVQEDKRMQRPIGTKTVNIAVVRLPAISNFTDLGIFEREPDVVVNYLSRPKELDKGYDCLILPGTKNVMEDAQWLRREGWSKAISWFVKYGGRVLGICGGYQLLGVKIKDPLGCESDRGEARGLGLLPIETVLEKDKVVRKVTGTCLLNQRRVSGYEIHMGRTRPLKRVGSAYLRLHLPGERITWEDGWVSEDGCILGTYVHGILDSPGFRGDFLNRIRAEKGLKQRRPRQGRIARFREYDRLADHFEAHCDIERIISLL
jgi:adenosylcobyric acid synthase